MGNVHTVEETARGHEGGGKKGWPSKRETDQWQQQRIDFFIPGHLFLHRVLPVRQKSAAAAAAQGVYASSTVVSGGVALCAAGLVRLSLFFLLSSPLLSVRFFSFLPFFSFKHENKKVDSLLLLLLLDGLLCFS